MGGGGNGDPKGTSRVTALAQADSKKAGAGRPFFPLGHFAAAALVSVTLLGYLFWGHDWSGFTLRQKTIYSLEMIPPIAVYLAAFLAELPAFGKRWPVPPGGRILS